MTVELTVIDLMLSDPEDNAMPAPMKNKCTHLLSPSTSPSLSPPTPSSSSNKIQVTNNSSDDLLSAWPTEFYVVDIVQGFKKYDEAHHG